MVISYIYTIHTFDQEVEKLEYSYTRTHRFFQDVFLEVLVISHSDLHDLFLSWPHISTFFFSFNIVSESYVEVSSIGGLSITNHSCWGTTMTMDPPIS